MAHRRIESFEAFWPYYLSEHRNPWCRIVHFIGTSGFLCWLIFCLIERPVALGAALAFCLVLGTVSFKLEGKRSAGPVLLAMIAAIALAHPAVFAGVLFAYGWAWVGHFRIEGNRPATFTYPLWSLAGDFRMYGQMCTGRLWSGDPAATAPTR